MLFALAETLLGGGSVPFNETLHDGPAIGLHRFLLDLLLMTLIFSPIEVLWPAYPKQGVFRPDWSLDVGVFPFHPLAHQDHNIPGSAAGASAHRGVLGSRGSAGRRWAASPGWCSSSWRWWSRTSPNNLDPSGVAHGARGCGGFHAIRPFLEGARLDRRFARPHRGRRPDPRVEVLIPMMFVFSPRHHRGLPVVCHDPRHGGAYELRPEHQVAGALLGLPEIPPLGTTRRRRSRSTRTSPSTSRGSTSCSAPLRLPRGQVAGHLRLAQRADTGGLLGADLLSVRPKDKAR